MADGRVAMRSVRAVLRGMFWWAEEFFVEAFHLMDMSSASDTFCCCYYCHYYFYQYGTIPTTTTALRY
jgi:hypothetical protein